MPQHLTGISLELAARLSDTDDTPPGMTYGELLLKLGSPQAVLQLMDDILEVQDNLEAQAMKLGLRFNDNLPTLHQPESDDWTDGQYPLLAWDGGFDLAYASNELMLEHPILMFVGNEGPGGSGKTVYRPVGYTDYIAWHRCEALTLYEHGFGNE